MDNQRNKRLAWDLAVSGFTIALASVLIPALFPETISVSPLVVFGIVFTTNTVLGMIPDKESNTGSAMFGHVFFTRLAAALLLAVLLILIETFAHTL
ncbi:hypothetical protein [Massilia sp. Leaf139]|uniref:hypothetical protein n=1 Tax=Massilia sp. Leaf139 TaxID=1736272 RepID=UPI0007142FBE|nr:hypothetical protein [Massilia sp. Leaf139]KQQ96673.1 hypothetical protein ASF77_01330 [Massilia sp. Leaf139]